MRDERNSNNKREIINLNIREENKIMKTSLKEMHRNHVALWDELSITGNRKEERRFSYMET